MMKYKLVSPDGTPIDAILSRKSTISREGIDADSFNMVGDRLDWEYNGNDEDEITYDDTVVEYEIAEDGGRLFEDENGSRWPESKCKLEQVLDEEWYAEQAATLAPDV
jgi:hypothetical protein